MLLSCVYACVCEPQPLNEHAMLFLSAGLLKRHVPHAELKQPRDAPASTAEEPIKTSPLPHVLRECPLSRLQPGGRHGRVGPETSGGLGSMAD